MSIRPLSREELREIDRRAARDFGLPTLLLMENAGRGAALILETTLPPDAKIVVVCGMGNNGGDGGVVARHLDGAGFSVRVVRLGDPAKASPDAATQADILQKAAIHQEVWDDRVDSVTLDALFAGADWIVDALLGTGLSRPVEGVSREVIAAMNRSKKPILSLDIPSGLDADRGEPLGDAVQATITATFVAPKLGFGHPGASRSTGRVEVVAIGVPSAILGAFRENFS